MKLYIENKFWKKIKNKLFPAWAFRQELKNEFLNIEKNIEELNKEIKSISKELSVLKNGEIKNLDKEIKGISNKISVLKNGEIKNLDEEIKNISKEINDLKNKDIKNLKSKNIRHFRLIEEEIGRINIPIDYFSEIKMRGKLALDYLIDNYNFNTVLDIGCGEGKHSKRFVEADKKVTAIDYGKSEYFNHNDRVDVIIDDFNQYSFKQKFDCVWASHILEHQLNVNVFLKKIFNILNEDGILAITVPPAKLNVVGGHVSIWSPGLLIYNLILAGFDCSEAIVGQYDYDISVIVKKSSISDEVFNIISYDVGDIRILRPYFPKCIDFITKEKDDVFNGANVKNKWVNN